MKTMIYFIVNPAAGSGKALAAVRRIKDCMRGPDTKYKIIQTERPDDYERVSGLIDAHSAQAVLCVGGDGIAQEYSGLAISLGVPYGVIPMGSANDLLYSIPGNKPVLKTLEDTVAYYVDSALNEKTVLIDAVSVNEDRYLLNIGGCGIDIKVLEDALPLKKYFGGGAYFLSMIKNAATYKDEAMTITIDGKKEDGAYLLLAAANGSYYGGRMRIVPPAVINDGELTLCVVKKMPRIKRIFVFPLVKPGWHGALREVSYINCKSVKVEFQGVKTVNLDGNLLEYQSPLEFKIMKDAVKFII